MAWSWHTLFTRHHEVLPGRSVVKSTWYSKLVLCGAIASAAVPSIADAAITSVTVDTQRAYEGHTGYTYAEITVHGSVSRSDGTVGNYTVPAVVIYPIGS